MTTTAPHLSYRPVIDGLRAIAVLAVVAYHFGLPLPGGFAGVDVFFVLSGYLIGGLLWQELRDTGRLRLARFWLRRIRRLAPAFFAMLAATAVVGWVVLLPYDYREFGKEAISATFWLSNLYFWRGAGYFDGLSEEKPLLHTWSLSVEEQFYIVLPLLFLVLARWRGSLPMVLAALWALSLAACISLTAGQPTATFYLFPFRAWELLTGVLTAILLRKALPGWVALAGLALILAGLTLIRAGGFPGWQAMIPVAGTALVLSARDDGPVARMLSHPVPVFFGLISYSLYLWHWPVMVLSRYWRDGWSGWAEATAWLALTLALSVASWALVERPVRRSQAIGPRLLAGGFVAAVAAALAFGLVLWRGDGLAGRFGPEARVQIAASQDFLQDWSRCSTAATGPFAGVETCAIGPDGPPRVVIWGDSHLRALMDGLALAADTAGVPGVILWHAGCPPLTGIAKQETAATPAEDAACTTATARTLAGIEELRPEAVLLAGRWAYYASGNGIGLDAQNRITLVPDGVTGETQAALYAAAWQATVARLTQATRHIFVFRQVPELPDHDSRALARALAHHRIDTAGAVAAGTVAPEELGLRSTAEAPIAALAASGALTVIDPWPLICTPDCTAVHDGQGWYFDNNHLTNAGAIALAPLFAPVFEAPP